MGSLCKRPVISLVFWLSPISFEAATYAHYAYLLSFPR